MAIKAVVLFSEGLDSSLAVKLMQEQGIDVIAVNFVTPFGVGNKDKKKNGTIIERAKELNVELKLYKVGDDYLQIVENPRYGYGKNLNPCIACRIWMFKKAKELMHETGAKFIVSGEVLGQRPMSQKRYTMEIIEKESGLEGFIVRPLTAKLLTSSIPEQKGWVKREKFFDILGRSRIRQFDLAKKFKITNYDNPAGGCLLTDSSFCLKIKDLINSDMFNIDNINLIKNGRYFNISNCFKLVVGRNEGENAGLLNLAGKGNLILEPVVKGPVAIGRGEINDKYIQIALEIVAYYCKGQENNFKIKFSIFPDTAKNAIVKGKMTEEVLSGYRIKSTKKVNTTLKERSGFL
ncbi:tRNA 4-thiouridine(8) synthase ThiI [bacterium]|nr:tRNA 4-thiouridine(8) synthase ThiI [bacterium]